MREVEIIKRIGHGGNAEVYLGKCGKTGESCVIKRAMRKKEAFLQLENEHRMLKYLRAMGYKQAPAAMSYSGKELVMEYIEGATLDAIEMKGVTEREFIKLIVSICEAVEKLHGLEKPVIHRDIKPSNMMLDEKGKVHLIDLGTARIAEGYLESANGKGSLPDIIRGAGTKRFAAPEQYGGLLEECFLTDIYQLGKTIEFLIQKGDFSETFEDEMSELIEKCCKSSTGERYHSISEFRSDVLFVRAKGSGNDSKIIKSFYKMIKRKRDKKRTNSENAELFIDIVRTFDTIEFL